MKPLQGMVLTLASFLAVARPLAAAVQVVMPIKDSIAVYQHETPRLLERPLFKASLEDRLLVVESGKDRYLVKNRDGREGWIEKKQCVKAREGKTIRYDSVDIKTVLDNPQPLFVGGDSPLPDDEPIALHRSFSREVRSNVDKDEIEKKMSF
jgi:hypothetical protein